MVRILFVHPDLGIGGAERLVIDAAVALQNSGHLVSFLTNHYDKNHCFEETKNGTLTVITAGDWLPRSILGKFAALCAYIRMIYAALYVVFYVSKKQNIDVIFCDQISLGIPILRLAGNPKILFYCHFPDQLLSSSGSYMKKLYRIPLNYLEEKTTGNADAILVNSKFTQQIFAKTFKSLKQKPDILYPSLNTESFDNTTFDESEIINEIPLKSIVFLSINRYERKKNLPLALKSFKLLESYISRREWKRVMLVMAGGYDKRVEENVKHYNELVSLCAELNLTSKVIFLQSPSDKYKMWLLRRCEALLYTPENEHFGIVPLESMYLKKPVIAVNSGGPTETIRHESTGFLCDLSARDFAESMSKFIKDKTLAESMGEMGKQRVQDEFSFEAFSKKLEFIVDDLLK